MFKHISDYLLHRIQYKYDVSLIQEFNNVLIIDTAYGFEKPVPGVTILDSDPLTVKIEGYNAVIVLNNVDKYTPVCIYKSNIKYLYVSTISARDHFMDCMIGCMYVDKLVDLNTSGEEHTFDYCSIFKLIVNKARVNEHSLFLHRTAIHTYIADSYKTINNTFDEQSHSIVENFGIIGEYYDDPSLDDAGVYMYKYIHEINLVNEGYISKRDVNGVSTLCYNVVESTNHDYRDKYLPESFRVNYLYVPTITDARNNYVPIIFDGVDVYDAYCCDEYFIVNIHDDIESCILYLDSSIVNKSEKGLFIYGGSSLKYLSISKGSLCKQSYLKRLILTGFIGNCEVFTDFEVKEYIPGPYIHSNKVNADLISMPYIFKETVEEFERLSWVRKSPVFPLFFGKCKDLYFPEQLPNLIKTAYLFKNFECDDVEDLNVRWVIDDCIAEVNKTIDEYISIKRESKSNDSFRQACETMSNGATDHVDSVEKDLRSYIPVLRNPRHVPNRDEIPDLSLT